MPEATPNRKVRALQKELDEVRKQFDEERVSLSQRIVEAQTQLNNARALTQVRDHQIRVLQETVKAEQIQRVAAQRGLVRYMKDHGLGDRIGYDPDTDRVIQDAIEAGIIPIPVAT